MGDVRVGLVWERPGVRVRPERRLDVGVEAEVAVVVAVGGGRSVLAVTGLDGPPAVVSFWDTATGTQAGEPLSYPAEAIQAMVVLPREGESDLLAVAYRDADGPLVQVWDPVTRQRVGETIPGPFDGSGLAAVPMPDGRCLLAVVEENDGTLRLWDPVSNEAFRTQQKADIWAVAADRSTLLTLHGDEDEAVVWSWDPATGERSQRLVRARHDEGDPNRLAAMRLADGRLVLAVARGHEDDRVVVRLWDAATGKTIGKPVEGEGLLPVPAADGTIRLLAVGDGFWDPGSGRRAGDSGMNATPLTVVPGEPALLAGPGPDGTLWLWDPDGVRTLKKAERLGPITLLAQVGPLLATNGSSDKDVVRFWDAATGKPVKQALTGHVGGVTAMAQASLPDGREVLVTCDGNGTIRSWDPAAGKVLAEAATARANAVRSMASVGMPDGRNLLAVGNAVNVLRLRDPANGSSASDMFSRLDRTPLRALAAVPMPDGRTLLAAGNATPAAGGSWAARLWDPVTGLPVGEPFAEQSRVWSLAATPAGHERPLLAVGTDGGLVQVHDVLGREVLGELPGRHPCLFAGPVLAVAHQDEVQFWDPIAWRRLASRRMGAKVLALAPVGSRLAVGCAEGLAVIEVAA